MNKFDELIAPDDDVESRGVIDRIHTGAISLLIAIVLFVVGLGAVGVALWYIGQFFIWLFLVFLQGAGPSTGNFQDPDYGQFIE